MDQPNVTAGFTHPLPNITQYNTKHNALVTPCLPPKYVLLFCKITPYKLGGGDKSKNQRGVEKVVTWVICSRIVVSTGLYLPKTPMYGPKN